MTGPAITRDAVLTLRKSDRGRMAMGGTVSYEVYFDGRWIGWVGDDREGYGMRPPRRWWACWREDGDQAARWNGVGYRTRAAAVDALTARVGEGRRS